MTNVNDMHKYVLTINLVTTEHLLFAFVIFLLKIVDFKGKQEMLYWVTRSSQNIFMQITEINHKQKIIDSLAQVIEED